MGVRYQGWWYAKTVPASAGMAVLCYMLRASPTPGAGPGATADLWARRRRPPTANCQPPTILPVTNHWSLVFSIREQNYTFFAMHPYFLGGNCWILSTFLIFWFIFSTAGGLFYDLAREKKSWRLAVGGRRSTMPGLGDLS